MKLAPKLGLILSIFALAACGEPKGGDCAGDGTNPAIAGNWRIGPVFNDKTRSVGLPRIPRQYSDGIGFDFPVGWENGHAHYVTFDPGSLTGKKQIVMRYRIEGGEEGFVNDTGGPGTITPYFQREGDDWSARPMRSEMYRWYASFAITPLKTGEHEIVAPLDANWTAVMSSSREAQPAKFQEALKEAACVGFVLGGGSGLGHGVAANNPARIVVTEYRVE